jgi:hypothetical protein
VKNDKKMNGQMYFRGNLQLTISKYVEWLEPQQSTMVQHLPHHSEVEGLSQMTRGLYHKTYYGRNLQFP